jgi:hypothetical protein
MGHIDPSGFRNFRKTGAIPAFLQGMLGRIFSRETGRINYELHDDSNSLSTIVASIRQVCLAFKKLEVECSPERVYRSLEAFVETERSFSDFHLGRQQLDDFHLVSDLLWTSVISGVSPDDIVPSHGPGATFEGISGNQKYLWKYWHERLEEYFPFLENGYPVSASDEKVFEVVSFVPPAQELPVKVTPVPKDLKGPRIIAVEPVCMQYIQQGIRSVLYKRIECHPVIGGHVNFTDQSINQRLALISSFSGQFSSIDLSEASDRVPHELALSMFRTNPYLMWAIDACRSRRAQMPDGRVISLRKFASMGSALCFPVEAMYFYTICVLGLLRIRKLPVTLSNVRDVCSDVYVYGDDILVPSHETVEILDYLQQYNCKVNVNKTFWHGFFRESCGTDAFLGKEVTPTYIRRLRPENLRQADRLISWVETANLFFKKGMWRTASLMWKTCERYLGPLPYVSEESPGLGRISSLGYRSVERWNEMYQRFEVKAWVPRSIDRTDPIDGYAALQKSLLRLEKGATSTDVISSIADVDKENLQRTARYGLVALKRRWVPA